MVNMPHKYDWSSVDWMQQDVVIARMLGCTRERVRQVRLEKRKPRARNHRRFTGVRAPERITQWAKSSNGLSATLRASEIAEIFGVHPVTVYTSGIAYKRYKPNGKRQHINLDLPNADIERIWGIKNAAVERMIAQHEPRWTYRQDYHPNAKPADKRDAAYVAAINAEKAKAAAWKRGNI